MYNAMTSPFYKLRYSPPTNVWAWLLLTGVLFLSSNLCAEEPPQTLGETDIRPFTASGRIALHSEAYTVSGIEARRPPGMGQVNMSMGFTVFGLQSGLNVLYSTNDNRLRQSMNRFNFHGTWRWLTVAAGTVGPSFTKYSLGGVSVTGGMIEMTPGWFSLTLTGGRSQRAVDHSEKKDFREPAFERWLYAARIGFGQQEKTQFAISGVYAHDVSGSLDDPGELRPAENINITPELNLSLFQGRFRMESNFTLSAFSRDQNSDKLVDDDELPGFLSNVFTPRTSTRLDYATELSARLNLRVFRLDGAYERVQPGFQSLGLGQIRSDQEQIRMRTQVRLWQGKANVTANFSHATNNLLNTRLTTMNRQQLGTNVMFRLGKTTNLMLSYMRMSNEITPSGDADPHTQALRQKQLSQNFMLTPNMVIIAGSISHNISVMASYQILDDQSNVYEDQPSPGFTNMTGGLTYGISLPSSLSFTATGNLMRNESDYNTALGQSVNVSTGYAFFDRQLSTSLSVGFSRNGTEFTRIIEEDPNDPIAAMRRIKQNGGNGNDLLEGEYVVKQYSVQYNVNLTATYRLPNGNPLRFNLRGLTSQPSYEGGREYNELHAVLRYEHRF